MDTNRASGTPNARVQHSIRSFFQPRSPQYSAPPPPVNSQTPSPALTQPSSASPPIASLQSASNPSNAPSKTALEHAIICPIEQNHIQPLRRINSLLLAINYPDSFYHSILTTNLSRIILWTDPSPKVVGGIVCRLDPSLAPASTTQKPQYLPDTFDVYIQSLALLSPYREKGLASEALESVVAAAVAEKGVKIRDLYAHVWTENSEGLKWYVARGFKREENVVQGYYRQLKPDTAWILRRRIGPSDYLAHTSKAQGVLEEREEEIKGVQERPGNIVHTKSFQDRRPDMEWNDLPEDVLTGGLLKPPSMNGSAVASASSSRSSSRSGLDGRGKKKRQYPAAAFGS